MNEFKGYKRRMELMTKIGLTTNERVELDFLEEQLVEFRKQNPDWQPGNQPFKVSFAELLKGAAPWKK